MYLYHADALAVGGSFRRPIQKDISSQTACSLPTVGGTATCQMGKTDFEGMISFDSAQTRGTGSVDDQNGVPCNVTSSSVIIENLNILNVVIVDRLIARLTGRHVPKTEGEIENGTATEPEIITNGCNFEGLRISGHAVNVETDHDLFFQLPTYQHWKNAWQSGHPMRPRVEASLIGSSLPQPSAQSEPLHLQHVRRGCQIQRSAVDLKPTVLSSFVRNAATATATGAGMTTSGGVVVVPHFGTIYLGEVIVSFGQRRVHMMRLELGSPDEGTFTFGTTTSNGIPFP